MGTSSLLDQRTSCPPTDRESYSFVPSETLVSDYGTHILPTGLVGTLNHRGFQLSTPNPLSDRWIDAYDGKLPLIDIGSAFGINTIKAAMSGADVVAIDMDEKQLEILRESWETSPHDSTSGNVTTMLGQFPELNIEDTNLRGSAILCGDVIHFLKGAELAQTFTRMHDLLKPGGLLVLSAAGIGMYEGDLTEGIESFHEKKRNNVKWPGEIVPASNENPYIIKVNEGDNIPDACLPSFLHVFEPEQIRKVAEENGFEVESCKHGYHPGLPDKFQRAKDTVQVHLIARRKK
eukprot:CFRG5799T1